MVVGAVTTAWDSAHAVVAAMGDRFVLLRCRHTRRAQRRPERGRSATPAHEIAMRQELAAAVGGLIEHMRARTKHPLSDDEVERLVRCR